MRGKRRGEEQVMKHCDDGDTLASQRVQKLKGPLRVLWVKRGSRLIGEQRGTRIGLRFCLCDATGDEAALTLARAEGKEISLKKWGEIDRLDCRGDSVGRCPAHLYNLLE